MFAFTADWVRDTYRSVLSPIAENPKARIMTSGFRLSSGEIWSCRLKFGVVCMRMEIEVLSGQRRQNL